MDSTELDATVSRGVTGIEAWRAIPNHADFEASNAGRVRRASTGHVMSPYEHKGYLRVELRVGGRTLKRLVHVLVLSAFAGPCPPGKESRHINGARTDNRWPENLVWGLPLENAADKLAHGTTPLVRIEGRRFGRLLAVRRADIGAKNASWLCQCDCGRAHVVRGDVLRRGRSTSCGQCAHGGTRLP
jgi:hypothetical protein